MSMWAGRKLVTRTLRRVKGDGNCLYHSVGVQCDHEGEELRSLLQRWMQDNERLLSDQHGSSIYEQALRRVSTGQWGESEEINFLSQMLDACIIVHTMQDGVKVRHTYRKGEQVFDGKACQPAYHIVNNHNIHYDALVR